MSRRCGPRRRRGGRHHGSWSVSRRSGRRQPGNWHGNWSMSRRLRRWHRRGGHDSWRGRRRRRQGRGLGLRHDRRDGAVDQRRGRDRRLGRRRYRHAGGRRVFREGGSQSEAAIVRGRLVGIVVERQVPKALARRRLLDVPGRIADRAVPCGRAGKPGVLRQARALDLGAHRAGAINPDPIWRPTAGRRCEPGVDAAEILVDLVQRVAARVEIDREVDRAAGRLAHRPRLAIGGHRIGVARGIGEVDRVGRMPFPDRDDLHPGRGQPPRLVRRQRRPARGRIAVIAGDEIEPRPALQFGGDIARVRRHVDAVHALGLRHRNRRQRCWLGGAAG